MVRIRVNGLDWDWLMGIAKEQGLIAAHSYMAQDAWDHDYEFANAITEMRDLRRVLRRRLLMADGCPGALLPLGDRSIAQLEQHQWTIFIDAVRTKGTPGQTLELDIWEASHREAAY